jgi:hypothetical protein
MVASSVATVLFNVDCKSSLCIASIFAGLLKHFQEYGSVFTPWFCRFSIRA